MIKQYHCYEELSVSCACCLVMRRKTLRSMIMKFRRFAAISYTQQCRNYRRSAERNFIHICKSRCFTQQRSGSVRWPGIIGFPGIRVDISRFNEAGISQLEAIRVSERNPPVITFAFRSFSHRVRTIFREAESMIEYARTVVTRMISEVLRSS